MSAMESARRLAKHARRAGIIALGILAAGVVTSLSVDLAGIAPAISLGQVDLRRSAEAYLSDELQRPVRIGGLSIRVFDGRFVVTDLVIEGLDPRDAPFLKAREIVVDMPLRSLLRRELFIASVEMTDWQLKVEKWSGGRHSFPSLRRRPKGKGGQGLFKTTLGYVRARRGQFTYDDHATPWSAIVRDFDITVLKLVGYRGYSTSSGGTVTIQSYTPMTADLRTWFAIDEGKVRFERVELDTDGAASRMTGLVDVGRWPEMTYEIESAIQLAPQRAIWWAPYSFTLSGEGTFRGQYHLFSGGYRLSGDFRSEDAGLNWYRFPEIEGSVVWTPASLDVTRVHSKFYGGDLRFTYKMAPLDQGIPSSATFDAAYTDVDLGSFTDAMEMKGLRLAGRASGHNLLEWRIGHWEEHHGRGDITAVPPPGVTLQGRELQKTLPEPSFAHVFGDSFPPLGRVPIGGGASYEYGPEWVDFSPGHLATPASYVEFQGRTAYGDRSRMPFHVTSSDFQQSGRELAGIITAFGSPTRPAEMGGAGTFDGTLFNAFWFPRVEGLVKAARMSAWDVDWGSGESRIVVENLYADVTDGVARKGKGTLRATGRFALGYPRRDHGEEIHAVITVDNWDLVDFRHAFLLDPYPYDGSVFGELHLWGPYLEPFGFGRVTVSPASAYKETMTSASAALRFDGPGVWLDGIDIRKGATGTIRGAAHVEWAGSYSFNADAHDIPLESMDTVAFPRAPLFGRIDFTAGGSGAFLQPTYDVDFRVRDLYVGDEGVGDVKGRFELRNDDANFSFDAASSRLAVSGAGKVTLLGSYPGDITLRLSDTSLDPYARLFMPSLSPFASAVASGTVRVSGSLASLDNIVGKVQVDRLALKLFDYGLQNDGPIDVGLEQGILRVGRFKLSGEDTRLSLNGNVDVVQGILGLRAEGAANLGILQAFTKNIRGSGRAEVTADFTGSLQKPQVGGSATITAGRLRHMWLPHAVDNINGRVAFAGSSIRFDEVTASLGRGDVRLGGRVGLTGLWPSQFEVTLNGERMEIRYPAGFRSVVDADLGLRGTLEDPVLSGTVLVRRGELRRSLDFESGFVGLTGSAGVAAAAPVAQAPASSFPLRFDVRLTAPSTIEIDNKLARLTASADLRLRGTYDKPLVEGRAEVQRGDLWFEGKRYVVSRGTVDFPNPERLDPYFDVEAETRIRTPGQTYRVTFRLTGTLKNFDHELSSDPPLPEVDILSLLLGDVGSTQDAELRTLKTPNAVEQNLLVSRSARLLASPISSNVQKAVEQTFGLDSVQITPYFIDPSQQTARFSPGAHLTIGKRVSDRIYVTYSRSLTSTARDQVILLEYDQSDRLSWIVTQNEDRTYALDVRVRHVFR
jgi:hypothetical protein